MYHNTEKISHSTSHLFDYCISNPPYQNESNSAIFQLFQYLSFYISDNIHMIYPAQKWLLKSGKGVKIDKLFDDIKNKKNMYHLTVYDDTEDIFPTVLIYGGISIVHCDNDDNNDFSYEIIKNNNREIKNYNYKDLPPTLGLNHTINSIIAKTQNDTTLSDMTEKSSLYKINSSFIQRHNKDNDDIILSNSQEDIKDGYYKVYSNATSGVAGKADWFQVKRDLLPNRTNTDTYRVAVGTRSTSGSEKRSQLARCYRPGELFGDLRFCVGSFTTEKQAHNFMLWLKTPLIRTLCFSSARRIKNFGVNVPLLDSYDNSKLIDFDSDIEQQLEDLYDISKKEKDYMIKFMDYFGDFYQKD